MAEPASTLEQVRRIALDLPEAEERASDGQSSFFVGEKPFAHFRDVHDGEGRTIVAVRTADAQEARLLIGASSQTYSADPQFPAEWVSVALGGADIDWAQVGDRIARSWELAAPQRLLEAGGR